MLEQEKEPFPEKEGAAEMCHDHDSHSLSPAHHEGENHEQSWVQEEELWEEGVLIFNFFSHYSTLTWLTIHFLIPKIISVFPMTLIGVSAHDPFTIASFICPAEEGEG